MTALVPTTRTVAPSSTARATGCRSSSTKSRARSSTTSRDGLWAVPTFLTCRSPRRGRLVPGRRWLPTTTLPPPTPFTRTRCRRVLGSSASITRRGIPAMLGSTASASIPRHSRSRSTPPRTSAWTKATRHPSRRRLTARRKAPLPTPGPSAARTRAKPVACCRCPRARPAGPMRSSARLPTPPLPMRRPACRTRSGPLQYCLPTSWSKARTTSRSGPIT